ncbi:LytR/AlgR family response regulator transcription factor, partial [Pedobacter sp.]|uniref:LytR/AlgR family response regulator transcription factor n=1 Tax=Pedobacter sp. TaxID=1411316 RepID=UPI003D7F3E23
MSELPFHDKIRTLLVDDEEMAIHRLKKVLAAYPEIEIIAAVNDGRSAVELINTSRPDLVFLDIQMPEFNGFDVLANLQYMPMIVFVTAYEEYAVKAFEQNSLDYLLKPLVGERLEMTMKRVMEKQMGGSSMLQKIKALIDHQPVKEPISTIPVKAGNKINLIRVADICFFEATDKYVVIHTKEEEKLIEFSLTYLQDRLPDQFVRIHRSFIINKMMILEIHKYFKGTFLMLMNDVQQTKIKSAYAYKDAIKNKLLLP